MAAEIKTISVEKRIAPATLNSAEKCRRWCRGAGAFLVVALFIASWCVPRHEGRVTRLGAAFLPILVLMVGAELTAEPGDRMTSNGRWRLRRGRPAERALLVRFGSLVLHGIIGVIAFRILLDTRNPTGAAMQVARLAAGMALLYAVAALIFGTCVFGCLLAGYSAPALHRTPLLARSLGEFWSQRWNIVVSSWFDTFVFQPLARRGCARFGILCAFMVSGFFHAWPILAASGIFGALSTMAFFLIQGAFVLSEHRLRIHTWPVALARTWTISILLASSPLFFDPALRVFGL